MGMCAPHLCVSALVWCVWCIIHTTNQRKHCVVCEVKNVVTHVCEKRGYEVESVTADRKLESCV